MNTLKCAWISVLFCQVVTVAVAPGGAALPVNFCYGSTTNDKQHMEEANEHFQTLPEDVDKSQCEEKQSDENKFFILPKDYEMDVKPVKKEFATQPTDDMNFGDYARDTEGPFLDAVNNPLARDDMYLNDDSYPIEYPDGFNVEDYLTFFDTDEDNLMTHDSSHLIMRNDDSVSGDPLPSLKVSLAFQLKSSKSHSQTTNFKMRF